MPEVPENIPLDQIVAALARGNQPQEHRSTMGFARLGASDTEQTQGYAILGKIEPPGISPDAPTGPGVISLEPYPDADRIKYPFETRTGRRLVITISNMVAGSSDPVDVSSYITSERERKKVSGSTTALFRKASEVMQAVADRSGRVLVHTFRTNYPSLEAWAKDPNKGAGIFDWTILPDNPSNTAYNFRARATIYPRTSGARN